MTHGEELDANVDAVIDMSKQPVAQVAETEKCKGLGIANCLGFDLQTQLMHCSKRTTLPACDDSVMNIEIG